MPILLLVFALFIPRVVIVLLWLFSTWFQGVFDTFIIPVLGFMFLPYTLLWYTVVQNSFGGEWGLWQIIIMGIALAFDLAGRQKIPSQLLTSFFFSFSLPCALPS
jgi:hypothetical protein